MNGRVKKGWIDVPDVPADAGRVVFSNVAAGAEPFVINALCGKAAAQGGPVIYVARDGAGLADWEQVFSFVAPDIPVILFPAWDCLPYDRVSPSADVSARRLAAMTRIVELRKKPVPTVILTTANAILQRMPLPEAIASQMILAKPGRHARMDDILATLATAGFERVPTVREVGEYAVRGGILDIFAPGTPEAIRLDFFGDTLESVRAFDPATQRTTGQKSEFVLQPASEISLTQQSVARFRQGYLSTFGAPTRDDALYASITSQQRFAGMEHWLPLFHEKLTTLFDCLPDAPVVMEHLTREALGERRTTIEDHFEARRSQSQGILGGDGVPYKPLPPDSLYLKPDEALAAAATRLTIDLSPFGVPEKPGVAVFDLGIDAGRNFALERADKESNVFDMAAKHVAALRANDKRVFLTGWSEGSLTRLIQILEEHSLGGIDTVSGIGVAM
ncbi:MAG: transcription-repair coupling factor, partial [Oricola sp.]